MATITIGTPDGGWPKVSLEAINSSIDVAAGVTIDGVDISAHAAALDAHTKNPMEILRTGEYYIPYATKYEALTLGANTLYAIPLLVARNMTVDRIALQVSTLADPSNIRLGIYNNGTNLYPGTLLLDAGTVSGATTGVKTITISQALTKGIYWVVCVSDATPAVNALGYYAEPCMILGIRSTDFNHRNIGWSVAFTYAALPDPFTVGGSIANAFLPNMPLRLLSLD